MRPNKKHSKNKQNPQQKHKAAVQDYSASNFDSEQSDIAIIPQQVQSSEITPSAVMAVQRMYGNHVASQFVQQGQLPSLNQSEITHSPPVVQRLTDEEWAERKQTLIDEIKTEFGYDLSDPDQIQKAYGRFLSQSIDPSMGMNNQFWVMGFNTLKTAMAQEKQAIIQRIQDNYGIAIDDLAGIFATNRNYFGDDATANLNQLGLQAEGWTINQLDQVETVLKSYAPILGANRANSTLSGNAQEVTTLSRVDMGLDWESYGDAFAVQQVMDADGLTFAQVQAASVDDVAWAAATSFGLGDRPIIAGAIADYQQRLDDIAAGTHFATGIANDTDTTKQDPATLGETFTQHGTANVSLYNSLVGYDSTFPGDPDKSFRQTLAHELCHALIEGHQLNDFVTKFNDWWDNEDDEKAPHPANSEAPPSTYGNTNAAEDLAETAGFYFTDKNILTGGNTEDNPGLVAGQPGNPAPRRKEYMDRVVSEWSSQGIKDLGVLVDAFLAQAGGINMAAIDTLYQPVLDGYNALSDDEKEKVAGMWGKVTQHKETLTAAAPDAPAPVNGGG